MRRLATIAFALTALASPLVAQSHPDFSGKWVMDPKTAEGQMAPSAMTMSATQDAKTLKIESAATMMGAEQKSDATVNLDGSPSKHTVNTPNGPLELTSVSKWDGATLVVTTTADVGGQALESIERYTLEADGKTLRVARHVALAGQTFESKLAFTKQ
ncbi:MAG TPA: hypothetical protein VK636_01320 [Gemmatimonadaceae bacterium]|nr:hypothetical protein [Gemmatimonadaceae bacterium]